MRANFAPGPRATLGVGDSATFTKTILESDVIHFADASGDDNPLHLDENYARQTRFGHRIAHGILSAGLISAALARELPGLGTIFVELGIRFLKPVFIGDTVTARLTVAEIINPKRVRLAAVCVNQNGEEVAAGFALVVPPEQTKVLSMHHAAAPGKGN
jgi:3-hydroxybutyryl-CoA dehydratase